MIDFHCHLDLYPQPQSITAECIDRGMFVLSVTNTPSAWRGTAALAGDSNRICTALGLHPQLAVERQRELMLFDELLPFAPFIGEVGLDGQPELRAGWSIQVKVFEHVLKASSEAGGRILSIHSRRASGPVLDVLERFPAAGTPVLHWFSGPLRDLERAIALGCWFSVGPPMLASKHGRSLVARIPRNRLLTETDGPFTAQGNRPLTPWDVEVAAAGIAKLWTVSITEASRTIGENLRSLLDTSTIQRPHA